MNSRVVVKQLFLHITSVERIDTKTQTNIYSGSEDVMSVIDPKKLDTCMPGILRSREAVDISVVSHL